MENQTPKLTARQAQIQIIETIKRFRELAAQHTQKGHFINFKAEIQNVLFTDIFILYAMTKADDIRLWTPNETESNYVTIIYRPYKGCVISIESEPCYNLDKQRLMKRNINMN